MLERHPEIEGISVEKAKLIASNQNVKRVFLFKTKIFIVC